MEKGQHIVDYKGDGGRAVLWLGQWSGKIVEFT